MAEVNGNQEASPTRRSPGEARRLVLASAQELFATNGYSGTSTRQIAEHAGVNYSILYRNFGTKANLFDLAVVEPVRQFLSRYIDQWADHTELAQPADIPARAFIG
ncbi:MAG: TetR/AcrR family transcriptional regulator, partial [Acidimicrobiia bacterium]